MTNQIQAIHAMEILDSRGNPTLRVFVTLDNGLWRQPDYGARITQNRVTLSRLPRW